MKWFKLTNSRGGGNTRLSGGKRGLKSLLLTIIALFFSAALCVGAYFFATHARTDRRAPAEGAAVADAFTVPTTKDTINTTPEHTHDSSWEVLSSHSDTKNPLIIGEAGTHKKYYLTADITLAYQIQVAANSEVTICLDGHVIKYTGGSSSRVIIGLNSGVTLNLYDCNSANLTHNYSVDSSSNAWTVDSGSNTFSGGAITSGNTYSYSAIGSYLLNETDFYYGNVTVNMYGGALVGIKGNANQGTVCLRGTNNAFNMYGGFIAGNKCSATAANGEAVSIRGTAASPSTFNLEGGILNNSSLNAGSVVDVQNGAFNFKSGSISNNKSKNIIYLDSAGFVMEEGYICKNTTSGRVMLVTNGAADITINGGYFCNNDKGSNPIFELDEYSRGTLSISNAVISDNNSNYVVRSSFGALNLDNCEIDNNTCSGHSVIFYLGSRDVTVNNCKFRNNKITYSSPYGVFYVGSADNYSGKLTVTGTEITGDSSHNGYRGVFMAKGSELEMRDVTISGMGSAGNGGGLYSNAIKNTLTRVTVKGNTTSGSGGGLYFAKPDDGVTVTITDSEVTNNKASGSGSGIYVIDVDSLTITDTKINSNQCTGSSGYGGGLYSTAVTNKLSGVQFDGNVSKSYGGGAYINCSFGTSEIINSSFTGNTATLGGGAYIYVDTLTIKGGEQSEERSLFNNNVSQAYGGGISIKTLTRLTIENIDVTENEAVDAGAGIDFMTHEGTSIIKSCTISHNTLTGSACGGAGIADYHGSNSATFNPLTIQDSEISYNLARKCNYGGGLRLIGSTTLINCTVNNNEVGNSVSASANIYGGGIYLNGNETLTIQGGSVSNNICNGRGGGIYTSRALTVTDCTIDGNSAYGAGGGIYATSTAKITGGSLSNNHADATSILYTCGGGGIYCGNAELVVDGTQIIGNTVKCKGTNSSNYSTGMGGGIYSEYRAEEGAIISNATISDNVVTGHNLDKSSCGGGVCAYVVTMDNCTVTGNSVAFGASYTFDASSKDVCTGGGVYVYYNGGTIKNSTISGNTAKCGAGVGAYIYSTGCELKFINSTITENTAEEIGGGIYLSQKGNNRAISLENTSVTDNTAKSYAGVYLHNESTNGYVLKLAGAAKISGNTTKSGAVSNVRLIQKNPIQVVGKLTDGAEIWFSLDSTTGPIARGYYELNGEEDPAKYFFSEDDRCAAEIDPTPNASFDDSIMVVSAISYKAMAQEHLDGGSHDNFEPLTKKVLTDSNYTPVPKNGSKMYYLTDNLTITSSIKLTNSGSNMILCLNGYKITAKNCSAFLVDNSSQLYIIDCRPTTQHIFNKGNSEAWTANGSGAKTVRGGAICLERDADATSTNTNVIQVEDKSKLFMNGGSIVGARYYGVLAYRSSEVNFTGTTFVGNSLAYNLIQVSGESKINLTDVTIKENTTGSSYYLLNATSSSFKISGGEITQNTCGVGVLTASATANIDVENCYIHGNTSKSYLANVSSESLLNFNNIRLNDNTFTTYGVYVRTGGTFNMTGGEICGNVSEKATTSYYAAVYVGGDDTNWEAATFNMTGGKIADNKFSCTRGGGGVVLANTYSVLNLSGNAQITGNKVHISKTLPKGDEMNVCMYKAYDEHAVVNVAGAMEDGARVGLTIWGTDDNNKLGAISGILTNGYKAQNGDDDPTKYFYSDSLKYDITQTAAGELTTQVKLEITLDLQYKVTEYDEEGNAEEVDVIRSAYTYVHSKLAEPEEPLREGHVFTGWFTDKECTNAYNFNTIVAEEFTLYAGWEKAKYTVSFNVDGGSAVSSQTIIYNEMATAPETEPTKSGYKFVGWFIDAEKSAEFDFANTPIVDNTTVYAGWVRQYSVVFVTSGGTAINKQLLLEGEKVAKPADPKKRNHVFRGWFTDSETTQEYDFNGGVSADMTLYAKWEYRCEHLEMKKTAALAPTCVTAGNSEYFYCHECDKYFAAADGSGEAARDSFTLAATGVHTPVTDPAVPKTCLTDGKTEGSHCKVCNEILVAQTVVAATGHTPGGEATCTTAQTCTVCKSIIKAALGHAWATEWSKDADKHWHACTRCGDAAAVGDSASHDFEWIIDKEANYAEDGSMHQHCTVCGYDTAATVIPQLKCTHSVFEHHEKVAPDCVTDGTIEYWYCTICEEYFNDANFTHKIADATNYDAELFKLDALGHDYVDSYTAPTCTEDGETRHTCSRCDDSSAETIEKLGHDLHSHDAKVNTCTEIGWNAYETCSRCDYSTYDELPAAGHSFGEWTKNDDADCNHDGTKTRVCQNGCGTVETVADEGSKLEHDFSGDYVIDTQPTCTTEGSKSKHCSRCGEKDDVQTVEKLPHVSDVPASCTDAEVCKNCGAEMSPAKGHAPAEEWSDDETSHWHECANCGAHLDNGSHTMTVIVVTKPTFEKDGLGYEECSVCQHAGRDNVVIPKITCEHNGLEAVDAVDPTCEDKGNTAYWHCTDCNKYYSDAQCINEISLEDTEIEPTGHDWEDDYTVDSQPDCLKAGSESIHCATCGQSQEDSERAIPATEHDWAEVFSNNETHHWYECLNGCGTTKNSAEHDFKEVVDREPTTELEGEKHNHCEICGYNTEPVSIPVIDCVHPNLAHIEATAPTCVDEGNPEYWHCTDCGYYYSDENCTASLGLEAPVIAVDPEAHNWAEDWSSDETHHWYECLNGCGSTKDEEEHTAGDPATCTTAQVCTVCNAELEAALGHDWAEEWATDGENHWHVCTRECGEKCDFAEHAFEWITDKQATFTEEGEKHEECTVCGKTRSEGTVIPVVDKNANEITGFEIVESVVYGEAFNPVASATYGTVEFVYSNAEDGEFSATKPTAAGTYYVKATVAEGEDYCAATSEVKSFEIKRRAITVSINAASSVAGDELEALSASVTQGDIVQGDNPYTLKTDADKEVMGEYEITGECTDDNYEITFIGNIYIVSKKATDPEGGGEIDLPIDVDLIFSVSQSETKNEYPDEVKGLKRGYWAQLWERTADGDKEYTGKLKDSVGVEKSSILTLTVPDEIIKAILNGGQIDLNKIAENLGVYYVKSYAEEDGRKVPSELAEIANYKLKKDGDKYTVKFSYDGDFGAEIVFSALNAEESAPQSVKSATPWWVWLIVGLAGAAVVGVVIIIVVVAKKKNAATTVVQGAAYDDSELKSKLDELLGREGAFDQALSDDDMRAYFSDDELREMTRTGQISQEACERIIAGRNRK